MTRLSTPCVPISWGELLDKITILQIKRERIDDPTARANVARELETLWQLGGEALSGEEVAAPFAELKTVNEALWEIEDAIRQEEARGLFGPEFIRLARAVYHQNDLRAALKRELNRALRSELVEEKSYWTMADRATAPMSPLMPTSMQASGLNAA